jgi:hypothetical protein
MGGANGSRECAPDEAIPIMIRTAAMGFAKRSTHPTICCPTGNAPAGQAWPDLPAPTRSRMTHCGTTPGLDKLSFDQCAMENIGSGFFRWWNSWHL